MRKRFCQACEFENAGVKTRKAIIHTCSKAKEMTSVAPDRYSLDKELGMCREILDKGLCPESVMVAVSASTPIGAAMEAGQYVDLSGHPAIKAVILEVLQSYVDNRSGKYAASS